MNDLTRLTAGIAEQLKQRGETVAVAETSAGGLVSASLLAVPGASAYFLGGGVLYTHDCRRILLRIADSEMVGIRSSSEPYAELLARTMRDRFETTWGVAETGAAGPTGNRYGDAAGHTCVAVAGPVSAVKTLETGVDDRTANMQTFTDAALDFLQLGITRQLAEIDAEDEETRAALDAVIDYLRAVMLSSPFAESLSETPVWATRFDVERLNQIIEKHVHYTNSSLGRNILERWEIYQPRFVKVMPVDYRRALEEMELAQSAEIIDFRAQGR